MSKKPANTAFKQQRLKAWQPILLPRNVLPTLFAIGILFIPLGAYLLHLSNSVYEINIDYSKCRNFPQYTPVANGDGEIRFQNEKCFIRINLKSTKDIFLYYKLTNFYQNHRWYVKSMDRNQLMGNAVAKETLVNGDCSSMAVDRDKIIYPCGLIANSIFNDTFSGLNGTKEYVWNEKGIAWPSDKDKYADVSEYALSDIVPPPSWKAKFPNGYTDYPKLKSDEHFQVWMRTAGLPTFSKLWGKISGDVEAGTYVMEVADNYDVASFAGTKSIVISTVTAIGGKNDFLGIAYIIVGCICIVLGILFLIRHCMKPRKLGDVTYLSWNQQGAQSGQEGESIPMERLR